MTSPITILAPCSMLGYGIPERSLIEGMKRKPDVIGVDAGSTDPRPHYLGVGKAFTNRVAYKRDMALVLDAAKTAGIPVLLGSAGGAGGAPHLDYTVEVFREICQEKAYHFRVATIEAEIPVETLKAKRREGKILPLDTEDIPSEADFDECVRVVGQMGYEPFMRALEMDVDVVLAGRAYDPAPLGALPMMQGYDPALVVHMGKILECGGAAAYPRAGADALLGWVDEDAFYVEPPNPDKICTVASVAAHTLYEKSDPYNLHLPGGTLDLHHAVFTQYDERTVKVSGSQFVRFAQNTIKLEGVRLAGYRTITIAGTRDPQLIANVDAYMANIRERVSEVYPPELGYSLLFHVYGKNGVMGPMEPQQHITSHELCFLIEVIADTAELSASVLALARSNALHATYPGRRAIAGNLAFPFSPSDIPVGEVYEFNVYHLCEVDDPCELFTISTFEV
ncbi:3-methylaspartate ammonia-lyase [Candidatus Entotheonella serta]|nr:3-methylaspartate ammonia-lyase [Candidatus Entotheonella serta]